MQQFLTRSSVLLLGILAVGGILFVACDTQVSAPSTDSSPPRVDAATSNNTGDSDSDARQFLVQQGDNSWCVTALSYEDHTAEDFYNYGGVDPSQDQKKWSAWTPTRLEENDVSKLFFYEGANGTSLFALHGDASSSDKIEDDGGGVFEGGGHVSFQLEFEGGLPSTGKWVVLDDFPDPEDGKQDFDSVQDLKPVWDWGATYTDGGVWRGGFESDFKLIITPSDLDGLRKWELLDGGPTQSADPPEETFDLDFQNKIVVSGGCKINVNIDIKPNSDPNAFNPNAKGTVPVAVLHTDFFDPAIVDMGTVEFGDPGDVPGDGAEPAHDGHFEDYDEDGDKDLILHFPTGEAGFDGGEEIGELVGKTTGGRDFVGTHSVKLAGGGNGGGPGGPGGN